MQQILGNKDSKSPIFHQGDVILKRCGIHNLFEVEHESIPKDAKEISGNLVLKGQTNSHALYGGTFQLSEKDGVMFVKVDEPTVLDHVKDHLKSQEHAEHHAQWIPVGEYFVDGVLEYDHLLQESRRVID